MPGLRVVRFDETEKVTLGPLAWYNAVVGADAGFDDLPFRMGIQTSEPGYVAPVQAQPYLRVLHVLEGEFEAWVDGRENRPVRLSAGDTLVVAANARHGFRTVGNKAMRLLATQLVPQAPGRGAGGDSDDGGPPLLEPTQD